MIRVQGWISPPNKETLIFRCFYNETKTDSDLIQALTIIMNMLRAYRLMLVWRCGFFNAK